jgi:phospholipid transport system transporter-binding protein
MSQPAIQTVDGAIRLDGPITLDTLCGVREAAKSYIGESDWIVDWGQVDEVDSTALSLILNWQRESALQGKRIRNINLPVNLKSLAQLYGISDLIAIA